MTSIERTALSFSMLASRWRVFQYSLAVVIASGIFVAGETRAYAGDFQLESGVSAGVSSWRDDKVGGSLLRFGYRFAHIVSLDTVIWEHYGTVDRRVNTGLTLGVTGHLNLGAVQPFLRVYAIHQHEEGIVSIKEHPWGATFGIGAGIRHRAGGGASLGAQIPFFTVKTTQVYARASVTTTWFPDDTLGPHLYGTLDGAVGVTFDVSGAK